MPTDANDSVDFWKKQCADLEKVIKTLSGHCVKVVEKHEDLLTKYKQNQEQYDVMVKKLKDKGEQIKKAREVLEPITLEYQTLREKYEIALQCQYEAETYASSINQKNKVLKRQSQMILEKVNGTNIVEINFDDEELDDDREQNEYITKLNQQISDLEDQKYALSAQVKDLHEKNHHEKLRNDQLKDWIEAYKTELEQAKETIAKHENTMDQLAKTSEAAVREYEELQKNFEKELTDRTIAVKLAQDFYAEREAARRQSAMLMKDVGNEKKLMEALIALEEVTTEMETVKKELEHKIEVLEQLRHSEKETSGVQTLEIKNSELMQERDALLQNLADAEKSTEQLRSQYDMLIKKYEDLEKKLELAVHAPPPPPPPPPLPPVAKTGSFLAKITGGGKKKQREKRLELGGAQINTDYSKAVDEMMKRIKQGNALKPVLRTRSGEEDIARKMSLPNLKSTADDDEGSAMKELQGILNKMKKARSDDDLSALDDGPTPDENSELAKAYKRIHQRKQEKKERPTPTPRKLSTIKDDTE